MSKTIEVFTNKQANQLEIKAVVLDSDQLISVPDKKNLTDQASVILTEWQRFGDESYPGQTQALEALLNKGISVQHLPSHIRQFGNETTIRQVLTASIIPSDCQPRKASFIPDSNYALKIKAKLSPGQLLAFNVRGNVSVIPAGERHFSEFNNKEGLILQSVGVRLNQVFVTNLYEIGINTTQINRNEDYGGQMIINGFSHNFKK